MKKGVDSRKILVLCLFSILLASFIMSVASAQPATQSATQPSSEDSPRDIPTQVNPTIPPTITPTTPIVKVQEIFIKIFRGDENYDYFNNVLSPQILFGILIFLIIFAIISQIGFFNKPWLRFGTSLVISILSAGFINPEWFGPLINQYTAIGVTISLVLPFALLFYFLKNIAPHNRLVQKLVWGIFFIIVFVNILMNWSELNSKITKWIYGGIAAGSFIMIIAGHKIFNYLFKEELHSAIEQVEEINALIQANDKQKATAALYTFKSSLSAASYNRLKSKIDNMAG